MGIGAPLAHGRPRHDERLAGQLVVDLPRALAERGCSDLAWAVPGVTPRSGYGSGRRFEPGRGFIGSPSGATLRTRSPNVVMPPRSLSLVIPTRGVLRAALALRPRRNAPTPLAIPHEGQQRCCSRGGTAVGGRASDR